MGVLAVCGVRKTRISSAIALGPCLNPAVDFGQFPRLPRPTAALRWTLFTSLGVFDALAAACHDPLQPHCHTPPSV